MPLYYFANAKHNQCQQVGAEIPTMSSIYANFMSRKKSSVLV